MASPACLMALRRPVPLDAAARSYEPFVSYGFSKLANIMVAKELQRRMDRWAVHTQGWAVHA